MNPKWERGLRRRPKRQIKRSCYTSPFGNQNKDQTAQNETDHQSVECKPPTKSGEIRPVAGRHEHDHAHESNDVVTPRESMRQPWQQTFFFSSRPFPYPSNLPTNLHRTRNRCQWRYVPAAIPCSSAPNPNERIPFPVPSQEQNNKRAWFHRSPAHGTSGRGTDMLAIARWNPPRENIDKGGGR